MSRRAAPKSERVRQLNIGAKAASFASSSARATRLSEHCNNRGIFITSCRTIRDWCTMFMFKFRRAQGCRKHRRVTTKSLFVWKRGNRATSIPKAKSSKCSEPQLRPESTCCRSSGNMICPLRFQRVFSMKRIEFRNRSNRNSSKGAKICAINSSSRSIRMTRATLMMRSTLKRSTTPAFGGSAFTSQMFPERLSNGVCSLNPDVDRLTHSVFIEFDKNGRAKNAGFARSVIRSAKRLTYKEAYAILQARPNGELSRRLHTAWELASLLRRKRFEQGSLDLDFPEVKVHVDADGKPTRLERVENDQSHQLIEEFMLAANEAVARELRHRSIATIYRVHEDPDPEKLGEYREFILSFGYKVGDLSHRKEVQRFLASISGKPEEQALKIGLLKSLKRARYAAQPLGHYGLAKANYLHFTSPIRRYADLVVHRTL